ncbi:MAG TPA: FkbM family methyltransferase [Phycisphaerales bacterium]|nr:FkbM family methyltransferase [Phycisphaerales bacterium]
MRSAFASFINWLRSRPVVRRIGRAAVRLIPDIRWTAKVEHVGPMRIRLRRHRWIYYGDFARTEHAYALGAFGRLVKPGDVVYDVGANIGLYVRVVCDLFKARRVIAFEPMTENYDLLIENIALGDIQGKVQPLRLALSDVEGEDRLQIDDVSSGSAVLDSVSGGQPSAGRLHAGLPPATEPVRIVPLDVLIAQDRLDPPDVIKIDTEGAEIKVLAGARQTLRQHKPRLYIALHGEDKARGTIELLDELGYATFGLVKDPGGMVHRQLHAADAPNLGDNNIVASMNPDDVREPIEPYR